MDTEVVGIFLIFIALIAFGMWLVLYTRNYSDWFKLKPKKTKEEKKSQKIKVKQMTAYTLNNIKTIEANLQKQGIKQSVISLDLAMRTFFVNLFNLNKRFSQTSSEIISELNKQKINKALLMQIARFFRELSEEKYDVISDAKALNLFKQARYIIVATSRQHG